MQSPSTVPSAPRRIDVPHRASVDQAIRVALSGFPPGRTVALRASVADPHGRTWSSHALFQADDGGVVDLTRAAPVSGSYRGIDGDGLLWSLEPQGQGLRAPFDETSLAPLKLTLAAELDGSVVATATVERHFVPADGLAIPVEEDGLVGRLFRPAGDGPFPTVLVISGSAGGQVFSGQCAALLAGHGYASLALSYFGDRGLPEDLIGVRLEYFGRAIRWLRAQPWSRDGGVAVVGRSRGGELALLIGATFPEVRAVIAYCPSNVVWGGLRNRRGVDEPAWLHGDVAVPYLAPRLTPEQEAAIFRERPFALRPIFEAPVDPQAARAATIPVERIRGPVLVFSGDDDRMWPADTMCDAVMERLARHGHPHPFSHRRYESGGHLLRAPCMPTSVVDSPMFALGGTPEGQARANRQAWTELLRALAGGGR